MKAENGETTTEMRAKKPKIGEVEGLPDNRIKSLEDLARRRMKAELDRSSMFDSLAKIGLIDPFANKRKGEDA